MARNGSQFARLLRECLEEGRRVEIDGLGVFRRRLGAYEFVPHGGSKVFLAYVQEDHASAERLFEDLRARGFDPWLDRKKLLPGQNWPRAIRQAIEVSDFFVACLSRRSVTKRGQFPAELRYALDCAHCLPLDDVFFIPVRLDDCAVPRRIMREIQYVDLFPDWEQGLRRVVAAMEEETARRRDRLRLAG